MTYFTVLLTFVVPPLLLLAVWVPWDVWRWLLRRGPRPAGLPYQIVLLHVIIALIFLSASECFFLSFVVMLLFFCIAGIRTAQ